MNTTPEARNRIEGQRRHESYQPPDNIIRDIDTRLKENPFMLTSADYKDLTRSSWGDSIAHGLFGGLLVLIAEVLGKLWVDVPIESWEPYAALALFIAGMVLKFQGPKLLDRKLRRPIEKWKTISKSKEVTCGPKKIK